MDRTDEHLLELAAEGDAACFGELIERWERRIFGFIYRYVGNREEAKDLTQDTFTKAFRNLGRLTDRTRFSSWLYKIALNECRMRFRRESRFPKVSWEQNREELQKTTRDHRTPATTLENREQVHLLREVIGLLPEEQKLVIIMKEYQGLKFHEISEILGIPLSTAKSRMYLGLKTIRKLMEEKT